MLLLLGRPLFLVSMISIVTLVFFQIITKSSPANMQSTTTRNNKDEQEKNNNNNSGPVMSTSHTLIQDSIPQFNDDNDGMMGGRRPGGVVLFHHIPKTGGTTLRRLFRPGDKYHRCHNLCTYSEIGVHFARPLSWHQFQLWVPRIEAILTGPSSQQPQLVASNTTYKEIFVMELHGQLLNETQFGLPDIDALVTKWHGLSRDSGVPFFPFTVVREPLSFFVSFFHFYFHSQCTQEHCGYTTFRNMTDESNLLRATIPNAQSKNLLGRAVNPIGPRDEDDKSKNNHSKINGDDNKGDNDNEMFATLQSMLYRNWYVFTTNQVTPLMHILNQRILSQTTLLAQEWTHSTRTRLDKVVNDDSPFLLTAASITNATRQKLQTMATYDQQLYEWAQQRGQQLLVASQQDKSS